METSDISREQAAAALATIEASRGLVQVERARRRGRRYAGLALGALNAIVEYGSRDLIASRGRRWALLTGWALASYGLGWVLVERGRPVITRMPVFRPDGPARRGLAAFAGIAGMVVAERGVVMLLRRSRLRRPNIVAGLAVAGLRVGFRAFVLNRIVYAGQPADGPATSGGQLHPALLLPDTLRVAALLGGGEAIDLAFIRETFGIERLDLAEDLQPLFDNELAATLTGRESPLVYLTPDGREAYAQHLRALQDLSTGGTPR